MSFFNKYEERFYKEHFFVLSDEYNQRLIKPFFYPHQEEILKSFKSCNEIAILKPRQSGITSILALEIAKILFFERKKTIYILSPSKHISQSLLDDVHFIIEMSQSFNDEFAVLKPYGFLKCNKNIVKIINSESKYSFIGETIDYLFVDEFSRIPNFKEILFYISKILNRCGKVITCSSYDGKYSEYFEKYFRDIERKSKIFHRKIIIEKKNNPTWRESLEAINVYKMIESKKSSL